MELGMMNILALMLMFDTMEITTLFYNHWTETTETAKVVNFAWNWLIFTILHLKILREIRKKDLFCGYSMNKPQTKTTPLKQPHQNNPRPKPQTKTTPS